VFGSVGEGLAAKFGTAGSPISLSTACASQGDQLGSRGDPARRDDAALCVATDGSGQSES